MHLSPTSKLGYLQNKGVSDVKRISIKRNDEIIDTNTYIFTFDRS